LLLAVLGGRFLLAPRACAVRVGLSRGGFGPPYRFLFQTAL
jgi:hypothetical protein